MFIDVVNYLGNPGTILPETGSEVRKSIIVSATLEDTALFSNTLTLDISDRLTNIENLYLLEIKNVSGQRQTTMPSFSILSFNNENDQRLILAGGVNSAILPGSTLTFLVLGDA